MFMKEIHEHYVTFGVQYTGDERFGEIHPMGVTHRQYVVIEAPDLATAQRIADAIFQGDNGKYSMVYDEANYTRKYQDGGEAFRIGWSYPWVGGAA